MLTTILILLLLISVYIVIALNRSHDRFEQRIDAVEKRLDVYDKLLHAQNNLLEVMDEKLTALSKGEPESKEEASQPEAEKPGDVSNLA